MPLSEAQAPRESAVARLVELQNADAGTCVGDCGGMRVALTPPHLKRRPFQVATRQLPALEYGSSACQMRSDLQDDAAGALSIGDPAVTLDRCSPRPPRPSGRSA